MYSILKLGRLLSFVDYFVRNHLGLSGHAGHIYIGDWHVEGSREKVYESCRRDELSKQEGRSRCLEAYPNAHVLTFWSHSWG